MREHTQGPLEHSSAGHGWTGKALVIDEYFVRRPGDDAAVAAYIVDPDTGNPSEANARRLVACWNALQHVSTEQLETGEAFSLSQQAVELRRQRDEYLAQLEWLQKVNTLHRQVDILYVVDGYEVTVTWDDNPISEAFHGKTVAEAISKAMAWFDLDVRHPYQDRDIYGHERQMAAMKAQRDELLAALEELLPCVGWVNEPDENMRAEHRLGNGYAAPILKARAAIAAAKGGAS